MRVTGGLGLRICWPFRNEGEDVGSNSRTYHIIFAVIIPAFTIVSHIYASVNPRPWLTTMNPYRFTEPPGWVQRALPGVIRVEFLFADRIPEVLERRHDFVHKKTYLTHVCDDSVGFSIKASPSGQG